MRVLLLLAEGVEEMEAVIVIDTLRRAGAEVVTAGLVPGAVTASRGVRLLPDCELDSLSDPGDFDLLVLPGGMGGTEALRADDRVLHWVRTYAGTDGKSLACICAAAMVVDAAGVLTGRRYTCHPSVRDRIHSGIRLDDAVVVDGNLTSSQGPGTAFAFALDLIRQHLGDDVAIRTAAPMILPEGLFRA